MTRLIYHIVSRPDWEQEQDPYTPPTFDTDGFVHCAFGHQVTPVIERFFSGVDDLIVLELDAFLLHVPVNLEPGTGGETTPEGQPELFPHVYGPLRREAVVTVRDPESFRPYQRRLKDYLISDDPALVNVDVAFSYLSKESYWAQGRPRSVVEASIRTSWTLTVTRDGVMVGMARVITDWTTAYYICDLFVLPEHQGQGLGKALTAAIVEHPQLQPLDGLLLTKDAHGMYRQFGFKEEIEEPRRFMRRMRAAYPAGR